MILYLIRHADAVDKNQNLPDESRYLTIDGRSKIKKMRSRIAKHGPKPDLILTSPLVRTVQTAEILAEKLLRKNAVIASVLLQPGADIKQLIKYVNQLKDYDCIMIVGHEPLLSAFTMQLLDLRDNTFCFQKGGCVALKIQLDKIIKCKFLWHLAPGKKCISSLKKLVPKK
jgi:phosphohistidine phosphatase